MTLKEFVASAGGIVVVLLALGKWFAVQLTRRLHAQWDAKLIREIEDVKKNYNIQLEELRATLLESRDEMGAVRTAVHTGYSGSQSRVLEALNLMWKSILDIRDFSTQLIFPHEVLSTGEIERPDFAAKISLMVQAFSDEEFRAKMSSLSEGVEVTRPFIGESLWRSYFLYRAFALRLAFSMHRQRVQGHYVAWNKNWTSRIDAELLSFPRLVIGEEHLQKVLGIGEPGVPKRLLDAMESKILEQMNEVIFGRRFASITVQEQERVRQALRDK